MKNIKVLSGFDAVVCSLIGRHIVPPKDWHYEGWKSYRQHLVVEFLTDETLISIIENEREVNGYKELDKLHYILEETEAFDHDKAFDAYLQIKSASRIASICFSYMIRMFPDTDPFAPLEDHLYWNMICDVRRSLIGELKVIELPAGKYIYDDYREKLVSCDEVMIYTLEAK